MLKKALAYRFGSICIGISINYMLFGSVAFAAFATFIFTVALTSYYILFHALWPDEGPPL